jgi:hypothetical protein
MTNFKPLPRQQALLDKLSQGGFKRGEMSIISAGRQTGKSYYYQYAQRWQAMQDDQGPKHQIIDSAEVDGTQWHTVRCKPEVSTWIRTHSDSWHEHIDARWNIHRNIFDISEELYMMMVLRWGS